MFYADVFFCRGLEGFFSKTTFCSIMGVGAGTGVGAGSGTDTAFFTRGFFSLTGATGSGSGSGADSVGGTYGGNAAGRGGRSS